MDEAMLRQQLTDMFAHASANGAALRLNARGKEIGISIPKGTTVKTIDKLVCDALDRLERLLS